MPVKYKNVYTINPVDALKRIEDKIAYVDKVNVWLLEAPRFDMNELKGFCGNDTHCREADYAYKTEQWMIRNGWKYKLELFQPTRNAFIYLRKNLNTAQYLINYVEIALDLTTDSPENITPIRGFFDRCWIKLWFSFQEENIVGVDPNKFDPEVHSNSVTSYTGKRKKPVKNTKYSNKPSKMNQKPCCHLEVRFSKSRSVRENRIDTFDAYLTPNFFYDFWKKHLDLRMMKDKEYINKMVKKTLLKEGKNDNIIRSTTNHLMRIFKINMVYTAQNVVSWGKYVNGRRRFLTKISNDKFLPSNGSL